MSTTLGRRSFFRLAAAGVAGAAVGAPLSACGGPLAASVRLARGSQSADYEETVERNVREQDGDARPAIANPLPSIDQYETVLLGSPIWNVRAPMIMLTFAERLDFSGKTVLPFTTYAMSGLGTVPDDYRRACKGARIGQGLAVRGEEVRGADAAAAAWLRRTSLRT
jgi:hypothetical protein